MAVFSRLTLLVLASVLVGSMAKECVTDSDCPSGEVCWVADDDTRSCKTEGIDLPGWLIAIIVLVIVLPICGVVALIIACCTCCAARKPAPRVVMIQSRPMYVPSQPAPIPACV
ncbi:unnamed protein product [Vitrella brassicaformis CCMP3155]|uniref:Uncharacterized protein n=1 Tax=Vitrella brassicaformis (strain CCMP3155) TaxID=1169540 RepID=A0A0G4FBP5_VITBC|nr:unnamed protein product [Vitrella brassicaformis CCMP3155]|eukprot:CEM10049.1 unnamed protein product [Vitrella brassicaformis CCMP3155]